MIIIDLIFNLALLISVSVLSGFIDNRWRRSTTSGVISQGVLFGLVALIGMVNPFVLAPGIIFDGRSVVLSLCALFFGPVSGLIAAGIALVYRIGLGGDGVIMGVSVIIFSTLIGSIFHAQLKTGKFKINILNLYIIGLIVHLVMVALIFAIPSPMRLITFKTITVTILGIFPIATALIGKILQDQSDSNERRKSEKALQDSEARFRSLFENSLIGISETEPNGKLINANIQFARLYGYDTPAEMMAEVSNVEQLYATREERNEIVHILMERGIIEPREVEVLRRDGTTMSFLISIREVRDLSGKLLRYQSTHVDITERRQAEQEILNAKEKAEQSDLLKTAFINNISHEIRTPLNGILGFTELLRQKDLNEEEIEYYHTVIHASGMRLLDTMTNYMDISMIASGTMELKNKFFSPAEVLHSLKEQFQPICAIKKLGLSLKIPEKSSNIKIESDVDILRKIFSLLLDNSIKFTKKGEISFGYSIQEDQIEFFVSDTGTGISKEAQYRIFEDFIQEEVAHTRGHEGSGLGLSIVKGLVRLLNGEIRVDSEKGAGSTFYFKLNVKDPKIEILKSETDIPEYFQHAKTVILMAEDDESNMRYMETILQKTDFTFIKAVNGQDAVDQCRAHPEISIVLMDIKMPVMDGMEATREIKSFRKDLPVIAITAYAMSGDEKRMIDAGCDDYLAKPLMRDLFLTTLEKYNVQNS
ncbi:MAG: response regulator [Bacteroidota bacterium]